MDATNKEALAQYLSRGCSVVELYNAHRPHSALGGDTPNEAYARKGAQPDPGLTPDQAEPKLKLAA